MKTQIFYFITIAIAMSLSFTACDEPTNLLEEVQQISDTPTEDALLSTEIEDKKRLVATVQKEGHELQFYSVGPIDNRSILMVESLYGKAAENESETFYISALSASSDEERRTPLEVFMAMTDPAQKVPEEIASNATNDQLILSGREVLDNSRPLEILDRNYVEPSVGRNCYAKDLGWTGFRNTYCWNNTVVSNPSDIRTCDSGKRTSILQRRTKLYGTWYKTVRAAAAINTVCGYTKTRFHYWDKGKWNFITQVTLGGGKRIADIRADNGVPKHLHIEITRPYNTGYFRAATRFY